MEFLFANLLFQLENWRYWISSPFTWLVLGFQIWMLIDAVRRQEYLWALFIFFFSLISALLYFFFVYRQSASFATQGFELPGAFDRKRIKELEAQIHHLDKAHHYSQLGDIYFQHGKLEKAEACYRAAMERDAEDIDTRAHLGQCFLRQKKPEEARPLLERVCGEDPKHDYGHSLMALAETLGALGEEGAAIETWKRVTENHSYPRARALLREVVTEDPYTPAFQRKRERVWLRRAKALLRQVR